LKEIGHVLRTPAVNLPPVVARAAYRQMTPSQARPDQGADRRRWSEKGRLALEYRWAAMLPKWPAYVNPEYAAFGYRPDPLAAVPNQQSHISN